MVVVGSGVSLGDYQLAEASRRAVMAWIWESDWAVGASVRAFLSLVIPWRMRYSRVTTEVVMVWWRNLAVSEICSALVLFSMIRWNQ